MDFEEQKPEELGPAIGLLLAYLFAMFVANLFLEPGITPPGYQGNGLISLLILYGGSFHAGFFSRRTSLFLCAGAVAAWMLDSDYLGDWGVWQTMAMGMTTEWGLFWHAAAIAAASILPPLVIPQVTRCFRAGRVRRGLR